MTMQTITPTPDQIDTDYRDRVRRYRDAVEHAIAHAADPVAAIASLRLPRREDCVPKVRNLAEARERVDAWNLVSANPEGYAGLVAIIPELAAHLGRYSDLANALHVGADVEQGSYGAAEAMTHELLMLAAIALAYAEGRLFSDAFNVTEEDVIR